jgi:DGQHR domain-containing protein
MTRSGSVLARRALRIEQSADYPLYLFSLTAREILEIADISRVARDQAGDLIGYQRPEVRKHIDEITEYLDSEQVIFPNSIIMALPSTVRFTSSRGPHVNDGFATGGTLEIPLPKSGERKPGWLVDGQQRALALARARRQDLAVPINAFIADSVDVQRDQFLRINNTKSLPRGLVTELLPEVSTPLPPRLALRQMPSGLCDLLNGDADSPFYRLIRRTSTPKADRASAVVTDTSIVNMLQESLTSPSGCLFPFRNIRTSETDFDGIRRVLFLYWTCVRDTFPAAWGRSPAESRLMHGTGIRAMGRLMDRIMANVDLHDEHAEKHVLDDLDVIASHCRWTEGRWDSLDLQWDEVQNVPRHLNEISNHLIRLYVQGKAVRR